MEEKKDKEGEENRRKKRMMKRINRKKMRRQHCFRISDNRVYYSYNTEGFVLCKDLSQYFNNVLIGQLPGRKYRWSNQAGSRGGVTRTGEFWEEEKSVCHCHPDSEEAR